MYSNGSGNNVGTVEGADTRTPQQQFYEWFLEQQRQQQYQAMVAQREAEYQGQLTQADRTAQQAQARYMSDIGSPAIQAEQTSTNAGGVGGMQNNTFAASRQAAIAAKAASGASDVYNQTKSAEVERVNNNYRRFGQQESQPGQSVNGIINQAAQYAPQPSQKESMTGRIAQAGVGLYDLVNRMRSNNIGVTDVGKGVGSLVGGIFSAPSKLISGFGQGFNQSRF